MNRECVPAVCLEHELFVARSASIALLVTIDVLFRCVHTCAIMIHRVRGLWEEELSRMQTTQHPTCTMLYVKIVNSQLGISH